MPNKNNKLINNGYLRSTTPQIVSIKGGGDNTNNSSNTIDDGGDATVVSPLLYKEQTSVGAHQQNAISSQTASANAPKSNEINISATTKSPSSSAPYQTNGPHSHTKVPTVVYLGNDNTGSGGGRISLQRNANVPPPYSTPPTTTDWLLKEPSLRRRLLVLAVAFTVLGAAIGALAIYFASTSYPCINTLDSNQRVIDYTGMYVLQLPLFAFTPQATSSL